MAGKTTFRVEFLGDAKGFIEASNDVEDKAEKTGGKLKALGGHLGDVAKIAGGFIVADGITKLGGFLFDAAKGAAEDARETARLEQALRNAGGSFDENVAKVNARIDAGAKLAFGDDAVRDSFQQLLAATGDVNESLDRQKLAMDLARGSGMSLEQASRMVSKVTDENVEAFKRMGITIGEGATEAEALAAVQAKFAGQSEVYAASTAGQFEQAKIRIGEAQEAIGTALLPVIAKLVTVFAEDVIPVIETFAEEVGPKVREFIENVKRYWESDLKPALENMRETWEELEPVITPLLRQIENAVESATKIIVLSLGIIVDLLSGDFSGAWDKTKALVREVVDYWWDSIKNAIDLIQGVITVGLNIIDGVWDRAWNGMKDSLLGIWSALQDAAWGFRDGIVGAFHSLFEQVSQPIDWIIGRIQWLIDKITSIPSLPDITPGFSLGFAEGTMSAPPGLHWVGERGPELMAFRGGEKVFPAGESRRMASASGRGGDRRGGGEIHVMEHATVIVQGTGDVRQLAGQVGWQLDRAMRDRGMAR